MPDDLLAQFHVGHQAIVNIIEQTQPLVRSYIEAKPKIREMREILISHFSKQNDELFNNLYSLHQHDRPKRKIIEFLIQDLKDLKIKYFVFFEKHSGEMGDIRSRDFPRDFSEFCEQILARIKIEEEYFFPLL